MKKRTKPRRTNRTDLQSLRFIRREFLKLSRAVYTQNIFSCDWRPKPKEVTEAEAELNKLVKANRDYLFAPIVKTCHCKVCTCHKGEP